MGFNVAQVIGGEHHAPPNLALDANVHLHRARCLVIGSKYAQREVHSPGNEVADEVRIGILETERVERLVEALEGSDVARCLTDRDGPSRGSAARVRTGLDGRAPIYRNFLWQTGRAGSRGLKKCARL